MVLSCAIGSKTLILDASPNDNGLFHEELIDYDVPGSWKTIDDGTSPNPLSECLTPFDDGRAAPSRQDVLEHWRATHKFGRAATGHIQRTDWAVQPGRVCRVPGILDLFVGLNQQGLVCLS